ncbi:MAG: hypothetical protein KAR20_03145, partial [Candidatus Heimdallarchaeota archaeon]|nr:hypothetical protein [Candidatus Heimdallarchaeota archaeon]
SRLKLPSDCFLGGDNGLPAVTESDALVQNIDLAPTYFEPEGTTTPNDYHIDGQNLVPLFKNGKANMWRDNLYFELGNAREVKHSFTLEFQ